MRLLYGLWLTGLIALPVQAQMPAEPAQVWQLAQARIGLSQAADLVARSTGGRVLSAQTVQEGGREIHRIKVLTRNGEVRIVRVDATSGRME